MSDDANIVLAKTALRLGRYHDMVSFVKRAILDDRRLATLPTHSGSELRDLLCLAYRRLSLPLRRQLEDLQQNMTPAETEFLDQIKEELANVCLDVIELVEKTIGPLLPNDKDLEVHAFYYKLLGDYYRYLAQITEGSQRKVYEAHSFGSYREALEITSEDLDLPLYLSVLLNLAAFFRSMSSPQSASLLIQRAIGRASYQPSLDARSLKVLAILKSEREHPTARTDECEEYTDDTHRAI
ncbi:14-3-3 domain-containing protein [Mycena amicta]|nr:14-3-3 domain-containing protein [Mycena amicta]